MKQRCEFFIEPAKSEDMLIEEQDHPRELKVRLDKWLWAARFFKTRALARNAIEHGKILYNNEKVKPSKEIQLDATVIIRQGRFNKTVMITGLSTRRKNSENALALFKELEQQETPSLEFTRVRDQNSSEYTNRKTKVVRFLRRTFNHSNAS